MPFPCSRFGAVQPIHINLIRDPLGRLVSSYYYKRFGDAREGHRTWSFKGTEQEKNQVCVHVVHGTHEGLIKFNLDPG